MKLIAKEGMIFTNGNTYANVVDLGIGDSTDNWYEITEEKYNAILEEESREECLYGMA